MVMIVVLVVLGLNLDNALGESGILLEYRDHHLDPDVLVLLVGLIGTIVRGELPRHHYHLETHHAQAGGDDVHHIALVAALTMILDGIRIVPPTLELPTADDADLGFVLLFQLLLPTYPNQP